MRVTYNHIGDSSKFLHESKMLGVLHALDHLVAVLYMLVEILHPGVEDVAQTVLSKVLEADGPVDPREGVVAVQPETLQLLDRIQVLLEVLQRLHEIIVFDSVLIDHSLDEGLILEDEVDDGLAVVLGDVLGLAHVG